MPPYAAYTCSDKGAAQEGRSISSQMPLCKLQSADIKPGLQIQPAEQDRSNLTRIVCVGRVYSNKGHQNLLQLCGNTMIAATNL